MNKNLQRSDYLPATKIQEIYGVSTGTLRNWEKEEKIDCIRSPGGKRFYHRESIEKLFHIESKPRERICYARVSSTHQKEDLTRQIDLLKQHYPKHRIIHDIGSGLNWKRKGFMEILDRVYERTIEEIVVLHKDRLCRFGIELVEFILEKAGTKLLVHDKMEIQSTPEQELAEDLLSIVTVFVARNNGKRAGIHKKERKRTKIKTNNDKIEDEEKQEKIKQTTSSESDEDSVESFDSTKEGSQ
jgi:putative resolvase